MRIDYKKGDIKWPFGISDLRSDLWTGSAIGVALLVVPVLIPVMAALARPVAKAVIKAGFMLYETGREAVAEISEVREDLAAAAKSGAQAIQDHGVKAELSERKAQAHVPQRESSGDAGKQLSLLDYSEQTEHVCHCEPAPKAEAKKLSDNA